MSQSPRVLLKFLGVSVAEQASKSMDFALLGGTMAVLLGDDTSAAKALAEYAAGLKSPPVGSVVIGPSMVPANSPEGRSLTGYISGNVVAPPGLTVEDSVDLALAAYGHNRREAEKIANQLFGWLGLDNARKMAMERLDQAELLKAELAIAMATSPVLLVVNCPVHESLHTKLKAFSQAGNTVLLRASALGQIPYGVERIALCDENGVNKIVRHSELLAVAMGGAEITVSFYPAIPRKQIETINGIENLINRDGVYRFSHQDTPYAINQLMNTARANARAVVDLSIAPLPPASVLHLFGSDEEPKPQINLFGEEEGS